MIPLSYAQFWAFFQLGVVQSDEDDYGPVCAVSDILTPSREEKRPFDSVEWNPILTF